MESPIASCTELHDICDKRAIIVPPVYLLPSIPNPSWLDSIKDSENDYDLIQSIDEEYIRGVESISTAKSGRFFLEPTFPILSR